MALPFMTLHTKRIERREGHFKMTCILNRIHSGSDQNESNRFYYKIFTHVNVRISYIFRFWRSFFSYYLGNSRQILQFDVDYYVCSIQFGWLWKTKSRGSFSKMDSIQFGIASFWTSQSIFIEFPIWFCLMWII